MGKARCLALGEGRRPMGHVMHFDRRNQAATQPVTHVWLKAAWQSVAHAN